MARLSLNQRREIVAFVGVPGFFCAVNDRLGLHLFGEYDRIAGSMGFVVVVLVVVFVAMPAYPEIKRAWESKKEIHNSEKQEEPEADKK